MPEKQWKLATADEATVRHLRDVLKVHPMLCRLLALRGVSTYEEAFRFFRPKLEHLHDPFLMKGMHRAVERVEQALDRGERILVYGDYDVDGTTAVALMYAFLSAVHDNLDSYQPDRYKEGYGISRAGIDYAAETGVSLIIALDCGIKAVNQAAYARSKGMDMIICDHHLPGPVLPEAVAVLDPKQDDCPYPYKELTGCGIGFKLAQALAARRNLPEERVYDLLDLLAVSIAADIVPITGENRVLTFFGLQLLNSRPRPGIDALLQEAGFKGTLTVTDLVFVIAPRINAAGRINHASDALELLLAPDVEQARERAGQINADNQYRRELDSRITEEALAAMDSWGDVDSRVSTVVYHPDWHKGVIGIVASRLIEKHYKPTVVLARSNGHVVGSARSVRGFDLYSALEACADMLVQFGGHKYAAGLTLLESDLPVFRERFERAVADRITQESRTPVITIDAELEFDDITDKFYDIVNQMAPFGPGNMKPVFLTRQVRDNGQSRIVKEEHLKLDLFKPGQRNMKGIAFGQGFQYEAIQRKTMFDVCYNLQLNEWNGKSTVELLVKDIR